MRLFTMLLLLGSVGWQAALAQQPGELRYDDSAMLPGGPVRDRIRAVIATVNSNDADRIRKFIKTECTESFRNMASMTEHIDTFLGVRRQTGGMSFHSIRTYVPERVGETVIILKDHYYESWRSIVLQFDADDGYRISGIQFGEARTPSNVTEPMLTRAQLIQTTRDLLNRLCEQDVFSGTLLLAHGNTVLLTHACGEASKRFHVPNNMDTRFNLGSMNKMFTATAIAQLVEQGRFAFDDPISAYVDTTWLPRSVTDRITIHHLLSHTSGLGSYFNPTYWNGSRELYRSVNDFKPLVQGETPAFAPGARFRYSNTGMLLLGVVIESVTGQTYFDYIREHIYQPAGMLHTDSYEMDFPVENLAIGYIPAPQSPYGWENNLYKHVIKGGPAGGGFSTVGDLHRFARALQTGKLVSEATLHTLWSAKSDEGYGYGFEIEHGEAGKVVGHGGGFPGLNSNLDIFIDRGYIVAVMSNYDQAATPVARRINQLIVQTD